MLPIIDDHDTNDKSTTSGFKRRKLETVTSEGPANVAQISRTDRGRIRGRRGHLKLMTEMPFDVLHEIFGQLDPIDLLHLSWSTRTLNSILMSRGGRFLWTNAFEKLYGSDNPPPTCPPDLNLAQYAFFLFGKRCMLCEVYLGNHRSWSMRLRICRRCLHTERFIRASKLEGPTEQPWWGLARISTPLGVFFFRTECDKAREKVKTMDKEPLARQQEEWRQMYDSTKEAETAYQTWLQNKRQERKEEICLIRKQRREAILQKLNDLGWEDVEICSYALAGLPEYSKPKPLTQKEWVTLQPVLIERLEGANVIFQQSRHRSKILFRLEVLQQRIDYTCILSELDDDERPFPEDIAILEPFKSTIFLNTKTEPECLFMDDSEFAKIVMNWHCERKEYILSLLPRELVEGSPVHDPLSLEVAYFCGNGDPTIQYYYQAICRVRQGFGAIPSDAPKEILLLGTGEFRRPWQWDRNRWTFDSDRYIVATTMMTYLGLDPRSTRPGDFLFNYDNVQLECTQCEAEEERGLRNCWSAIQHELQCHRDNVTLPGELKWRIDWQL